MKKGPFGTLLFDCEFVRDIAKQPGFWEWIERDIENS